jgi:hypothetical protein
MIGSWHFFCHILSPYCTCTLPWKLGRDCVLRLKLAFMPQRVPKSPMITWDDWILFFFWVYLLDFVPTSEPWWGRSWHRDPSRGQLGPVVAGISFYHILSPCCTCTLPWKLNSACVMCLKLAFMPLRVPMSPMTTWGGLNFFFILSVFFEICAN